MTDISKCVRMGMKPYPLVEMSALSASYFDDPERRWAKAENLPSRRPIYADVRTVCRDFIKILPTDDIYICLSINNISRGTCIYVCAYVMINFLTYVHVHVHVLHFVPSSLLFLLFLLLPLSFLPSSLASSQLLPASAGWSDLPNSLKQIFRG